MTYTTISDGASASVSLPATWIIRTTGSGLRTMGPGPLNGQTRQLGPDKGTIGPFDYAATVYLTGVKTLAYEASNPADVGTLTTAQTAALAAMATQDSSRYSLYLGLLGDSFTNNGYYTDGTSPDGLSPSAYWVPGANNNYSRSWGWSTWLGAISNQQIQVVKSWARQTNGVLAAGASPVGAPLSVQVSQMLSDPLYPKINRVPIMIGANDSAFSLSAWTAALLAQIARINRPIDLIAMPPRADTINTNDTGAGFPGWVWFMEAANICRRIAEASNGLVKFVNGYAAANTPGTVPDVLNSGKRLADNIHPNNVGALALADAYMQAVLPTGTALGAVDLWANNSSAADNATLDQGVPKPLMLAGGGTLTSITGTAGTDAALGFTLAAIGSPTSAVASLLGTSALGVGGAQRVAIAPAAAADGFSMTTSASMHNAGGTFLSAGDIAWAQCLVTLNAGAIQPRNLFLRLLGFNGANVVAVANDNSTPANELAIPIPATRSFLFRTPPMLMGATAYSSLLAALRVTYAGSGAATNVDISNFEVRRFKAGAVYA